MHAAPSPLRSTVSPLTDPDLHRALDRCAQVASALRALAELLAPAEAITAVGRDDLAMLLALVGESQWPLREQSADLVAARSAVVDLIGCRQELEGLTRRDLRALVAALAQVQAESVVSLSRIAR